MFTLKEQKAQADAIVRIFITGKVLVFLCFSLICPSKLQIIFKILSLLPVKPEKSLHISRGASGDTLENFQKNVLNKSSVNRVLNKH